MTVTVRDRALYGRHAEIIAAARRGMESCHDEADTWGRSNRLVAGWYIIPGAIVGAAFWGWLITKAMAMAAAVQVGGL